MGICIAYWWSNMQEDKKTSVPGVRTPPIQYNICRNKLQNESSKVLSQPVRQGNRAYIGSPIYNKTR